MRKINIAVKTAIIGYGLFFLNTTVIAQNTQSGYFNDGFLYRHEMNPAFGNEQGYVSMLGLGNIDVNMRGNVDIDNYFYNFGGKTTTFLNSKVDAGSFLSNVEDKNKIGDDLRLNILSVGFKGLGGYNTIGINLRQTADINVPGDMFRFMKEGVSNKTYDLSGLGVEAQAWIELALGHSRKINDQWRVGGKLKFLLGGANVTAKVNRATLALNNDKWDIYTDAVIESSVKGLTYEHETNENTLHQYVSGADVDGTGLNGFGLAVDLGGVFTLNEDWEFSAALLDLGYISWSNNMKAARQGSFSSDTYNFNVDEDATNSFENEWEKMRDGLSETYELDDLGDQGSRSTSLGATMNLAAAYTLPSYRNLTFGLMNTTRMNGDYSWTDFRLSTNWRTNDHIFSATADVAVGTYGASFGWLLNFHPNGINLFVGMDHTLGKMAKPCIPMSSNAHFNMGLNFPF